MVKNTFSEREIRDGRRAEPSLDMAWTDDKLRKYASYWLHGPITEILCAPSTGEGGIDVNGRWPHPNDDTASEKVCAEQSTCLWDGSPARATKETGAAPFADECITTDGAVPWLETS